MRLQQLFERTIKVPSEMLESILMATLYTIYLTIESSSSEEDIAYNRDKFETAVGYNLKDIKGKVKDGANFLKSKDHAQFIVSYSKDDFDYYHTSKKVQQHLDKRDQTLPLLVKIETRGEPYAAYNDSRKEMALNITMEIGKIQTYVLYPTEVNLVHARRAVTSLESVIEHELQHFVQYVALHPKQYKINKDYDSSIKTGDLEGYHTSPAEIKPHITNAVTQFALLADDELWDILDRSDRMNLFKMFVGVRDEPISVNLYNEKHSVNLPTLSFFKSLKKRSPEKFKKVVRDTYNLVSKKVKF